MRRKAGRAHRLLAGCGYFTRTLYEAESLPPCASGSAHSYRISVYIETGAGTRLIEPSACLSSIIGWGENDLRPSILKALFVLSRVALVGTSLASRGL